MRAVHANLDDPGWHRYLSPFLLDVEPTFRLHLGVFVEPYLSFVLEGRKTVESRFSVTRRAPYGRVDSGDVIFIKRSGGPIVGLCKVQHAWYYELDTDAWSLIKERFGHAICASGEAFWESRRHACYASLIRVAEVTPLTPIRFSKRDRRGWVTLNHISVTGESS